jgi:cytochrome b involved in lipid metabolism
MDPAQEKETLLLIAGGVDNVTRWLPDLEHPGGNTIILRVI